MYMKEKCILPEAFMLLFFGVRRRGGGEGFFIGML
jgi:hypothetical protein